MVLQPLGLDVVNNESWYSIINTSGVPYDLMLVIADPATSSIGQISTDNQNPTLVVTSNTLSVSI